jgi:hypothetical protein
MFELCGVLDAAGPFLVSSRERKRLEDWLDAYAAYLDRDWTRASAEFRAFLAGYGEDAACRVLLTQCESFITAPPGRWGRGFARLQRKVVQREELLD